MVEKMDLRLTTELKENKHLKKELAKAKLANLKFAKEITHFQ